MTDEKKLRGEDEHVITEHEKAAWERGKKDKERQVALKRHQAFTVDQTVKIVRLYAELGDVHFIATKFDSSVTEINQVLNSFSIYSIEDAIKLVNRGIIGEYETAQREAIEELRVEAQVEHEEASERLVEHAEELGVDSPLLSEEEKDEQLSILREDAQRKNKQDQLRQMIKDGIDPHTGRSNFRIPIQYVTEFKQLIYHGVATAQRRFGGTAKDIKSEVQRLIPDMDVDMLRP